MASWVDILTGAMKGSATTGGKTAPNDGSGRAKAQQEFEAARSNYANVMSATNDKGERDRAHQRLIDATAALGSYH